MLCLLLVVQMVFALCVPAIAASEVTVLAVGGKSNVRSGAGTDKNILGSAYAGSEYEYLNEARSTDGTVWYKIQYTKNSTGWICSTNSCKLTPEIKSDPQKFIETVSKAYGAVGVQVATINSGVLADSYTAGWAVRDKVALTDGHKIRTASLSKVAIAMTAMQMQEAGIVSIDSRIDSYWGVALPKKVTLRDLLTHTSTLSDLSPGKTPEELRAQLAKSSSYTSGTPGSSSVWRYNNYGAAVAGTTLEMASGIVIDNYADNVMFGSLGIDAAWMSGRVDTSMLVNTYYADGSLGRAAITSASLTGSNTPGYNAAYYAGGFTSSAADYAKLLAVLINDGVYDGVRYISAGSVAEMEKAMFTATENGGSFSQCLALRYKGGLYGRSGIYYHTGNAYGVLAQASYDGQTGDGVVVLTTGCNQGRDAQGIYSVCSILSKYFYDYMASHPRVPATDIALNQTGLQLELGQTVQLKATLTPINSDSPVEWISSEPCCVTVSENGTVTAVGHGSAVITASANGVSASCTVMVTPPDITLTMLGGSVRVSEPYGLRFGIKLTKDEHLASADVVEYGTLVVGAGNLEDGELTLDTPKVKRIPARNIFEENTDSLTYTGVIINIPRSGFNTELVGRGYLIYKDADGTEHVIYTDTVTRSFEYVATAAYENYLSLGELTQAQQNVCQKLKDILGITDQPTEDTEVSGIEVSSSDLSKSDEVEKMTYSSDVSVTASEVQETAPVSPSDADDTGV